MWEPEQPKPVKLLVAILAANQRCLTAALDALDARFGMMDNVSDVWAFTETDYYRDQTGDSIVRQLVSFDELVDPGRLARIKQAANELERELAEELKAAVPRPVNLDPGIIEPSKLILASTKNFSHRIYIGERIYAEVTLMYSKGLWQELPYTYPDYKKADYQDFFSKVRIRLVEQLKESG